MPKPIFLPISLPRYQAPRKGRPMNVTNSELVIMCLNKFIFAKKHISYCLKAYLSVFIAKYGLSK